MGNEIDLPHFERSVPRDGKGLWIHHCHKLLRERSVRKGRWTPEQLAGVCRGLARAMADYIAKGVSDIRMSNKGLHRHGHVIELQKFHSPTVIN